MLSSQGWGLRGRRELKVNEKLKFNIGAKDHLGSSCKLVDNSIIPEILYDFFQKRNMAGVKGLEPSTFGVTSRRSNQLSYTPPIPHQAT